MDKCRCLFETISTFAEEHSLKIEFKFEFDCIGGVKIKMTRDEYEVVQRISSFNLHHLWDCDTAILIQLDIMLNEIEKRIKEG